MDEDVHPRQIREVRQGGGHCARETTEDYHSELGARIARFEQRQACYSEAAGRALLIAQLLSVRNEMKPTAIRGIKFFTLMKKDVQEMLTSMMRGMKEPGWHGGASQPREWDEREAEGGSNRWGSEEP